MSPISTAPTITISPETCFKAVARVLRTALERDPRQPDAVPSTKGSLKG